MATEQEEALKILKGTSGDDTVEVTHLEGGITVIKVIPQKKRREIFNKEKMGAGGGGVVRKSVTHQNRRRISGAHPGASKQPDVRIEYTSK